MTRSAAVHASLLMRSRLARAAWVVAVAVPVLAIVPQQVGSSPDGYPISDSVDGAWLWFARTCLTVLPVLVALSLTSQRERGLSRQRVLDGEPPSLQTMVAIAVPAAAALTAGLASALVEAGVAAIEWTVERPVKAGRGWDVADNLSSAFLIVLMAVSVGALVAAACRRAVTAATVCVILGVGSEVFSIAANARPQLHNLTAALPQGVFELTFSDSQITASIVHIATAGALLWPSAAVVATYLRARSASDRPLFDTRHTAGRGGVRARAALAAAAFLLVVGYTVPVALRDQIPWQYRPVWLADKAAHRSSYDIAQRFVRDVRQSRLAAADSMLVSGSALTLLGPYRRVVRGEVRPSINTDDSDATDPGAVQVSIANERFDLCLTRRSGRWLIVDLRTARPCPPTLSR